MPEHRHFELTWRERPHEEAAHFNPAFCGELIARALDQYRKQKAAPLPLPLAFLLLPLVLHPATRRVLPRRADTAFASWAGGHADTLSTVPDRVLRLRPVSREALLFLLQLQAISVAAEGLSVGRRPMRLSAKLAVSTDDVDEMRRVASLLGRWFAYQREPASVLLTMGVRV